MIFGLHHASISTPDLDRAIGFYCGVMGGSLVRQGGWEKGALPDVDARLGLEDSATRMAIIRVGAAFLELFEYASPQPKPKDPAETAADHGIRHICFVVDDCQAEYERLKALGMRFNAPPLLRGAGNCFTYGRDPDGNIIELLEIPRGANFPNNYDNP